MRTKLLIMALVLVEGYYPAMKRKVTVKPRRKIWESRLVKLSQQLLTD